MQNAEDELLEYAKRNRPVLSRSFAGWVFRILGVALVAPSVVVGALLIWALCGQDPGLASAVLAVVGSAWLVGAAFVQGLVLLGLGQIADAIVTSARYVKLLHDLHVSRRESGVEETWRPRG